MRTGDLKIKQWKAMGFSNEVKRSMKTESDSTLQTSLTVVYLLGKVLGKLIWLILLLYIVGAIPLNVILKTQCLRDVQILRHHLRQRRVKCRNI